MENTREPMYMFSQPRIGTPFFETEFIENSYFEYDKGVFRIVDPIWGIHEIGKEEGDEVLLELLKNPLVVRSMAIEQLTLDRLTETIPGAAEFPRWDHLWGSVAFIRLKTKNMKLEPRERLTLQLRAFVSDLAHTAYSHLGDWIFQGAGGPENQHDIELVHLLEVSGVNEILRKQAISPEEVIFPDTTDWIEAPQPELCVDRVDYGAREIRRWLDLAVGVHFAAHPDAFIVTEDRKLVMKSHRQALNFAKAFMLLPTEHWGEPVHKLQLFLKQELVKRIFCSDETALAASDMGRLDQFHPRDYMYTIDADITQEMRFNDPFLNIVRPLMEDIGLSKRRIFAWQRRSELASFFSDYGPGNFPDPLKNYGESYTKSMPLIPSNIEILPVDDPDSYPAYQTDSRGMNILLGPLKPRWVDPLYYDDDGNLQRLSETDSNYKNLLSQQALVMSQSYIAKLSLNKKAKKIVKDGFDQNGVEWPEVLQRPRMEEDRFQRVITKMASYALSHRLANMSDSLYLHLP